MKPGDWLTGWHLPHLLLVAKYCAHCWYGTTDLASSIMVSPLVSVGSKPKRLCAPLHHPGLCQPTQPHHQQQGPAGIRLQAGKASDARRFHQGFVPVLDAQSGLGSGHDVFRQLWYYT
jgi:hypothetical protein